MAETAKSSTAWVNGLTGPLRSGQKLVVSLRRPEGQLFVNGVYDFDRDEVREIFNSFLELRRQYKRQKYTRPGGDTGCFRD